MADIPVALRTGLADRYRLERELGRGGFAVVYLARQPVLNRTVALKILEREAQYRAEGATRQGVFLYQFECIARNRLGYDRGLEAVATRRPYPGTRIGQTLSDPNRLATETNRTRRCHLHQTPSFRRIDHRR